MLLIRKLKNLVERIPYGIGRWAAYVPFSVRFGAAYTHAAAEIEAAEMWREDEKVRYAVAHFRRVFEYAREKFPCYRDLYAQAGVLDLTIGTLDDIAKVPTIDKAWTRAHFGEFKGADLLNTGGSSGNPTAFWMDKGCWGREWAHFHHLWGMAGYRPTDLKLAIRGKNLGKLPFKYNPVHNEYIINTYLNVKDYADELARLFRARDVRWFHGYPSSIYQFILECEEAFGGDVVASLFKGVKGLLLSSEFPHPYMVEKFRQYGLKLVSWYGHSEMCILAHDLSGFAAEGTGRSFDNRYTPYVTYGLTEVVDGHLIGTSYHNFDMPLIRYDTGDLVERVGNTDSPLVSAFAIREGRSGDFIEDKNGKKIPLTALIFGRHHKAFDVADYIQIGQDEPGRAVLYVAGTSKVLKTLEQEELHDLFDLTNVAIDFEVEQLDKPRRTCAGKLCLRV